MFRIGGKKNPTPRAASTRVPELKEVIHLIDGQRLEEIVHSDRGAHVGVEGVSAESQQERALAYVHVAYHKDLERFLLDSIRSKGNICHLCVCCWDRLVLRA